MKIRIICVGKLKEKFFRQACDEYLKRLSAYCSTEVVELKDESATSQLSDEQIRQIKNKEGEKILQAMKGYYTIILDLGAKQMNSPAFSAFIEDKMNHGISTINFVIGGSNGLSDEVRAKSDFSLSFSEMTFPHQLFRIMLLEQIYRGFKIMKNETYHK